MNKGIQHFQLALRFLSVDALSNSRGYLMLLDISVCEMEILLWFPLLVTCGVIRQFLEISGGLYTASK